MNRRAASFAHATERARVRSTSFARRRQRPIQTRVRSTTRRRTAARMASFKRVNITLGNIKSAIAETYGKLDPATPNATSPASLGATTDATDSRP